MHHITNSTMQAWTFTARGSPDQVLRLRNDMPQPHPKDLAPNEIIVKVSHAALFKSFTRLMAIVPHPTSNPWIPDFEFSGIITAIGRHKNETPDGRLKVYDPVFGMVPPDQFMRYNGALAGYIVVPYDRVALKPARTSFEEAAGLGGGGSTVVGIAEQAGLCVVEGAEGSLDGGTPPSPRVRSTGVWKRVLITGGSTGTGLFMIQLMKYLVGAGGRVVTTASPRNREAVLQVGADEVVDYTAHPKLHVYLAQKYAESPFDVVVDIAGSDPNLYTQSPAFLKPEGVFVFAGDIARTQSDPGTNVFSHSWWVLSMMRTVAGWAANSVWPVRLGGVPRRCFFHSGQPTRRNLEITRDLVERGVLKCVVDQGKSWVMEDAVGAYAHLISGKITGKVVVNVGGEGYEVHS